MIRLVQIPAGSQRRIALVEARCARALRFGEGAEFADGGIRVVRFAGSGRPSRNPIRVGGGKTSLVTIQSIA